jgi:uncharacterized protein YndB with AHSA1/START domain
MDQRNAKGDEEMGNFRLKAEAGRQDVVITYEIAATASRVFKAMTDPTLLSKWWGPSKYATIVEKLEPRPGGQWRYINRGDQGQEYGFHGVFHLVETAKRIVQTFEFEGMPGHVSLETMTLEERDGKTLITAHAVYQSVEDRDGMVQSGMESGARETYARLEEVVASG